MNFYYKVIHMSTDSTSVVIINNDFIKRVNILLIILFFEEKYVKIQHFYFTIIINNYLNFIYIDITL